MKTEENNLDHLKGKNPFKVPEGYMEGLTNQIMSQLPDKPEEAEKRITRMERIRPWLYMAAVFAGMGLFFKAIVGPIPSSENNLSDSLLVHTEVPAASVVALNSMTDDDEEYLEYIEAQYMDYMLAEELADSE